MNKMFATLLPTLSEQCLQLYLNSKEFCAGEYQIISTNETFTQYHRLLLKSYKMSILRTSPTSTYHSSI